MSTISPVPASMHPNQQKLIKAVAAFLSEVENLTPGKDLEAHLNTFYGPGNPIYEELCTIIRTSLSENEGWVATAELDGPRYRRSRVCAPCEETKFFSITTVFMDSEGKGEKTLEEKEDQNGQGGGAKEVLSGQYHQHPYGEINCVVQLEEGAELMGMQGWQGAGWTSPGPGTHHFPMVRGGALVALFFLPAGRISYDATPDMKQPMSV